MSKLPALHVEMSSMVAHVFYAVGHTDKVVVTTVHGDFTGALAYPDNENEVVITYRGGLPPLAPGQSICVEYSGPTDEYRFYTEILAVTPGRITATIPYAVESRDRRLTPRISLPPNAGFYFRSGEIGQAVPFPLTDISVGGVAFVDPTDTGLRIGQVMTGELLIPGEPPILASIEVRHLSLRRGRLQVGTRFAVLAVRERDRLARRLARWSARLPNT